MRIQLPCSAYYRIISTGFKIINIEVLVIHPLFALIEVSVDLHPTPGLETKPRQLQSPRIIVCLLDNKGRGALYTEIIEPYIFLCLTDQKSLHITVFRNIQILF